MRTIGFLTILFVSFIAFARDYYINPVNGSDSNDGSANAPLKHISRVHDISVRFETCNIILQPGIYDEGIYLRYGQSLIGQNGVIFRSSNGDSFRGIQLSDMYGYPNTKIENINLDGNGHFNYVDFYIANSGYPTINNIKIINCSFNNGISIAAPGNNTCQGQSGNCASYSIINILFENCSFDNTGYIDIGNDRYGRNDAITTRFVNCRFSNMGIDSYNRPYSVRFSSIFSNGFFDRCLFENNNSCFFCKNDTPINMTIQNSIFNNNVNIFRECSGILMLINNCDFYNSPISQYYASSFHIKDSIIFQSGNESDYVSNINCYYDDPLINSDFTLASNSPCRDAGSYNSFGIDETDFYGNPRVMGGRIDIGACEFLDRPFVFGDMNCDGRRDNFDIDMFVYSLFYQTSDCNILNGDMNKDGFLNNFDIDLFVNALFQ